MKSLLESSIAKRVTLVFLWRWFLLKEMSERRLKNNYLREEDWLFSATDSTWIMRKWSQSAIYEQDWDLLDMFRIIHIYNFIHLGKSQSRVLSDLSMCLHNGDSNGTRIECKWEKGEQREKERKKFKAIRDGSLGRENISTIFSRWFLRPDRRSLKSFSSYSPSSFC